ncbi:sialidase family protein [Azospirillum soli]|uniref:sialidase family protein n=1 Tax=Azospirillum soli TaxID=1304799 RepID=UPI001AE6C62A|nr:sialidase family protein [Azospirillum soli]MBP2310915.1 Neuraminidase (sialidase) [Azospirillum soli]
MLEILSHRVVYSERRFYSAFPSAATLADGTVLVAFRRARDYRWLHGAPEEGGNDFDSVDHVDSRSHLVIQRFSPDFETVGEPQALPVDPEAGDQDANLLVLRSGRIVMGSFCWYPMSARHAARLKEKGVYFFGSPEATGAMFLFWGGCTRYSDDGGRTWSPHKYLPELPDQGPIVPGVRPMLGGAVRGRAVEAPDGTLLMATYTGGPYTSYLFASRDRGESWELRSIIARDAEGKAGFCETALHLTEDGRLIAFHRTTGHGDHLVTSLSRDLGKTWEPWQTHSVIGHPYDACPLPDGRLLVVYGYRHQPFGVRARVWDPYKELLDDAPEFVIRDDAPSPDVGYPWATVLADGRVAVCYYICDAEGIRHIEATLLRVLG